MITPCNGVPLCNAREERVFCQPAIATRFSPVTPVTPVTPFRYGPHNAREASISPRFVTGEIDHPVTPRYKSILLTEIGPNFEGDRDDLTLAHVIKGGS